MSKSKLVKANEKIANTVVDGYKKIEDGVVGGFTKINDKFVDHFLTKENETVEDAKKRLAEEQKIREEKNKELMESYNELNQTLSGVKIDIEKYKMNK